MQRETPSAPQVGIFGGSFNPPHLAHLIIAELVREQFALGRILWIPNFQSPFKRIEEVAPAHHRAEMTRLAIDSHPNFDLNDTEVRRGGVSYTVDTIRALQEQHPDVEFSLIIGSDSLESFRGWHRPDEILARVRLIVFRRPGAADVSAPSGYENHVAFADAPMIEISGTAIRNRIHAGRSVRYLVADEVRSYIYAHELYGASRT